MRWNIFCAHGRPKLTIRGIDQILMIYVRVSSETWLPQVRGVMLHIERSTRHCLEFKTTKDNIAQWNKTCVRVQNVRVFLQTKLDNEHGDPRIFCQVFAKNSLMKNIFEEEKKFDSRTWFFLENGSQLGVFWPRRGLQVNHGTVQKSATFPQPSNQKRLKWSYTAYLNKWSFTFKIKLCVFQVTITYFFMKVIQSFNPQPVKIPHFKSPLTRKQERWP